MPLVIPGLQSKDGDNKTNKWMNDLMGKKIGDSSNETVRYTINVQVVKRTDMVVSRLSRRKIFPRSTGSLDRILWPRRIISLIGELSRGDLLLAFGVGMMLT